MHLYQYYIITSNSDFSLCQIAKDFQILHGEAAPRLFEQWLLTYADKVLHLARQDGKLCSQTATVTLYLGCPCVAGCNQYGGIPEQGQLMYVLKHFMCSTQISQNLGKPPGGCVWPGKQNTITHSYIFKISTGMCITASLAAIGSLRVVYTYRYTLTPTHTYTHVMHDCLFLSVFILVCSVFMFISI